VKSRRKANLRKPGTWKGRLGVVLTLARRVGKVAQGVCVAWVVSVREREEAQELQRAVYLGHLRA